MALDEVEGEIQQIVDLSIKMMVAMLENTEMTDALATYCSNFGAALREKGFTEEQAMQIICSLKFPEVRK